MSWTDKAALTQIKALRDYYGIKVFFETGTFKGVNAAVHAANFEIVVTCEKMVDYYEYAKAKLDKFYNVLLLLGSSSRCLQSFKPLLRSQGIVFFYLDAHFYDPMLPEKERWVVLKELTALADFPTCVVAIHDFDCSGLGHLTYNGQPLNFELLRESLRLINPHFQYYVNTSDTCDILTPDRVVSGEIPNLVLDEVTKDNLEYAWSAESKTKRGILYCTPTELKNTVLTKLET